MREQRRFDWLIAAAALTAMAACSGATTPPSQVAAPRLAPSAIDIDTPAPSGASFPRLSVAGDVVQMSWLERDAPTGEWMLVTARGDGATWEPSRIVTRSDAIFANWADFPSVIPTVDGALFAHWLQRSGPGTYSYDVRVAISRDAGASWSDSFTPHRDGTATEHGFVSMVPDPAGGVTAIWLDGRETGPAEGPMTLRSARIGSDGSLSEETLLDGRVCDCCQTAAAAVGDDVVVVYRDRSDEEIRDIWSVSRRRGTWQEPVRVAEDGWRIPGCPVNGPAVAARQGRIAVAWFALVNGLPEVKVAFSDDAGASWGEPVLAERGTPEAATLGRVDLVWLGDNRVAVSWFTGINKVAEIRARTVDHDRTLGEPVMIGTTAASRSSGFPRMIALGDRLLFAWTVPGDPAVVLAASLPLLPD